MIPGADPGKVPSPITTARIAAEVGICFLARQPGLPEMAHNLKVAVVTRHIADCGWCEYPPPLLVGWLYDYTSWDELQDARWSQRVGFGGRVRPWRAA